MWCVRNIVLIVTKMLYSSCLRYSDFHSLIFAPFYPYGHSRMLPIKFRQCLPSSYITQLQTVWPPRIGRWHGWCTTSQEPKNRQVCTTSSSLPAVPHCYFLSLPPHATSGRFAHLPPVLDVVAFCECPLRNRTQISIAHRQLCRYFTHMQTCRGLLVLINKAAPPCQVVGSGHSLHVLALELNRIFWIIAAFLTILALELPRLSTYYDLTKCSQSERFTASLCGGLWRFCTRRALDNPPLAGRTKG